MTLHDIEALATEALEYFSTAVGVPSEASRIEVSQRLDSRLRSPSRGAWSYFDAKRKCLLINERVVGGPIEKFLASLGKEDDLTLLVEASHTKTALTFILRGALQTLGNGHKDPPPSPETVASELFFHRGLSLVGATLFMDDFIINSSLREHAGRLSEIDYNPCDGSGVEYETLTTLLEAIAVQEDTSLRTLVLELFRDGIHGMFPLFVSHLSHVMSVSRAIDPTVVSHEVSNLLNTEFHSLTTARAACPSFARERILGEIAGKNIIEMLSTIKLKSDPPFDAGLPTTAAGHVSDGLFTVPSSLVGLFDDTPRIVEKIVGGTSYVNKTYYGIPQSRQREGHYIDGLFIYSNERKGCICLSTPLANMLAVVLSSPNDARQLNLRTTEGCARLLAIKSAVAALLHENIHALGTDSREHMEREFQAVFPGSTYFSEGITELATRMFLDTYLNESGLATLNPEFLNTPYAREKYVAELVTLSTLIRDAAAKSHHSEQEVVQSIVSAGGGLDSLVRLVKYLDASADAQGVQRHITMLQTFFSQAERHSALCTSEEELSILGENVAREIQAAFSLTVQTALRATVLNAPAIHPAPTRDSPR